MHRNRTVRLRTSTSYFGKSILQKQFRGGRRLPLRMDRLSRWGIVAVLESSVGFVHDSRPHSNDPIMSLRGPERRSNLGFGPLEIASGFALAMTIFQSFRVTITDVTFDTDSYSLQVTLFWAQAGGTPSLRTTQTRLITSLRRVPSPAILYILWRMRMIIPIRSQ